MSKKALPLPDFTFPRGHMRVGSKLPMPQWCEEKITLTPLDGTPKEFCGPWRNAMTPYLVEPMEAFTHPRVRHIIIKASSQSGKTRFAMNCVAYTVDQDPDPIMIVIPLDLDVSAYARKKVRTMVEASLPGYMTGKEDDIAGNELFLLNTSIRIAGSNSPAALASDSRRVVIFDEVNKYKTYAGNDANPLKLGQDRTIAYTGREKIIEISTPTTQFGRITLDYAKTDMRRRWYPCPRCGGYSPMAFSPQQDPPAFAVRWPKTATLEQIKLLQLAWMECPKCEGRVESYEKFAMDACGVWCPNGYAVADNGTIPNDPGFGTKVGYLFHGTGSPFQSWSDLAVEFLDTKDRPEDLMDFFNSKLGEEFLVYVQPTKTDDIKSRCGTYATGEVNDQAVILTAGVDVGKDHFWVVIRAWGYGQRSWLVKQMRVHTMDDLEEVLIEQAYHTIQGDERHVRLACIDSGYRTDEVYEFCMKYPHILRPTKGYARLAGANIASTPLETNLRGRRIPGGLKLYRVDTNYFKDKVSRLIHTKTGDPGEWYIPGDIDEQYLAHMVAEQKQTVRDKKKGRQVEEWQLVGDRANHLWDCEILATAAAEMCDVHKMKARRASSRNAQELNDEGDPISEEVKPGQSLQQAIKQAKTRRGGFVNGFRLNS